MAEWHLKDGSTVNGHQPRLYIPRSHCVCGVNKKLSECFDTVVSLKLEMCQLNLDTNIYNAYKLVAEKGTL